MYEINKYKRKIYSMVHEKHLEIMITLCVIPNFKGTRKEHIQALLTCLFLDLLYIVPLTTI